MENYNDIKILGDGVIPEGIYNNIRIAGACNIVGKIDANLLKISGSCNSNENIKSEEIKVYGAFSSKGEVFCNNRFIVNGEASILKGDFNGLVKVRGELNIKEYSSFENIEVYGELKTLGNFEGNSFYGYGRVDIEGLLSADKVEIIIHDNSEIKEIGGENISIKNNTSKKLFGILFNQTKKGYVRCNLIEGDNIYLENTICDIIRGENITIGKGCTIGTIEYSNNLTVDKESIVRNEVCTKN
ncbi:MAG: hypothetical protein KIB43_04110 [Clostridium baratii]|uniref:Polymer-forming cytoskeletal family protein n=1 Tax=Clostridium baratii str. Sullivan TaxID=1415775 RepID=A0A0A7FW89_9CLOT|nr:hypothetical protein [Clostridium baratii]AIY83121.1 polymer-forming cytoskeletal family protein [Clostridium baratii str. Sullivan]MBS6006120.1 hypothetical protein [Clostridium baratii]MDU1053192.1 hypothetical protein [Clostridium baratii]MDU4911279.1 hypothetical protein [Clostridium baratii]CUP12314.1 Integral membrane protein CcmA involved in cell shape determination [Clostridium baratii]